MVRETSKEIYIEKENYRTGWGCFVTNLSPISHHDEDGLKGKAKYNHSLYLPFTENSSQSLWENVEQL